MCPHQNHLAIDESTHEMISAVVSLAFVGDNEALPTLLNPLRRKIAQVCADGAYDTKACHQVLKKKGIKPTIPPRSNAGTGRTVILAMQPSAYSE